MTVITCKLVKITLCTRTVWFVFVRANIQIFEHLLLGNEVYRKCPKIFGIKICFEICYLDEAVHLKIQKMSSLSASSESEAEDIGGAFYARFYPFFLLSAFRRPTLLVTHPVID